MRKVKYEDIGKRLKEARIAAGYKQKDCLEPLGDVTAQMLSDWENGYVCPSITYLINLSKFYNVSLDYIILGKAKNEKDRKIRTYKDAAECMLELSNCGLFELTSLSYYPGEDPQETQLTTQNIKMNEFKREYDNLSTAAQSMKKELFNQALKDLLEKYDYKITEEELDK